MSDVKPLDQMGAMFAAVSSMNRAKPLIRLKQPVDNNTFIAKPVEVSGRDSKNNHVKRHITPSDGQLGLEARDLEAIYNEVKAKIDDTLCRSASFHCNHYPRKDARWARARDVSAKEEWVVNMFCYPKSMQRKFISRNKVAWIDLTLSDLPSACRTSTMRMSTQARSNRSWTAKKQPRRRPTTPRPETAERRNRPRSRPVQVKLLRTNGGGGRGHYMENAVEVAAEVVDTMAVVRMEVVDTMEIVAGTPDPRTVASSTIATMPTTGTTVTMGTTMMMSTTRTLMTVLRAAVDLVCEAVAQGVVAAALEATAATRAARVVAMIPTIIMLILASINHPVALRDRACAMPLKLTTIKVS
ncbi:hypothetical protein THAOC_20356 [Thalassiosira oceanica]|uniref:Uncharacterized protein n=1 Tax=Thalassiosira oceanica TaxID=159749 RepID=K0SEQ5_THAOC|nr:hypothetical protein THAOC_20356 [Thalassiosira oceanica]|eukprot:EJK59426.1 hypothetical protein THAOC_20356 [Thalassiosira oceanica]